MTEKPPFGFGESEDRPRPKPEDAREMIEALLEDKELARQHKEEAARRNVVPKPETLPPPVKPEPAQEAAVAGPNPSKELIEAETAETAPPTQEPAPNLEGLSSEAPASSIEKIRAGLKKSAKMRERKRAEPLQEVEEGAAEPLRPPEAPQDAQVEAPRPESKKSIFESIKEKFGGKIKAITEHAKSAARNLLEKVKNQVGENSLIARTRILGNDILIDLAKSKIKTLEKEQDECDRAIQEEEKKIEELNAGLLALGEVSEIPESTREGISKAREEILEAIKNLETAKVDAKDAATSEEKKILDFKSHKKEIASNVIRGIRRYLETPVREGEKSFAERLEKLEVHKKQLKDETDVHEFERNIFVNRLHLLRQKSKEVKIPALRAAVNEMMSDVQEEIERRNKFIEERRAKLRELGSELEPLQNIVWRWRAVSAKFEELKKETSAPQKAAKKKGGGDIPYATVVGDMPKTSARMPVKEFVNQLKERFGTSLPFDEDSFLDFMKEANVETIGENTAEPLMNLFYNSEEGGLTDQKPKKKGVLNSILKSFWRGFKMGLHVKRPKKL